jgi:hypothetical protein
MSKVVGTGLVLESETQFPRTQLEEDSYDR